LIIPRKALTPRIAARGAIFALALLAASCSGTERAEKPTADALTVTVAEEEDPWLRLQRIAKWTGDLDGMAERGFVRLLTVYSPTHYFVDGAARSAAALSRRRAGRPRRG
jgi:hypothetical protein